MQKQHLDQKKKNKQRLSLRPLIFILVGLSLVIGTVLWIANGNDGKGHWSTIFSVLFVAAGLLVSLLQWLFPISKGSVEETSVSSLIVRHVPSATALAILPTPSSDQPKKYTYRGMLGVPPPTDARTIQQRTSTVKEIYAQFATSEVTMLALIGI